MQYSGGDLIASYSSGFVRYYHGVRGDLATISTTRHGVNADYSCYNESLNGCSRHIVRRAVTSETIVGNSICAALGKTEEYRCFELLSNDAPVTGYDKLRQLDSNGVTGPGDSGSGWKTNGLMHGIHKGSFSGGANAGDALFTHAWYIENYLGRTICGGSGNCDN